MEGYRVLTISLIHWNFGFGWYPEARNVSTFYDTICCNVNSCMPQTRPRSANYAGQLLQYFVSRGRELYGEKFLIYNIHSMLHLREEVRQYGSLDACSAFNFENYMQQLKKLVRSGKNPLVHVVKRLSEIKKTEKPIEINTADFPIATKSPNNCYLLVDAEEHVTCCEVLYPSNTLDRKDIFVCRVYEHSKAHFTQPCDSRIRHIYRVNQKYTHLREVQADNLTKKAIRLDLGKAGELLFLAILHQL